MFVGQTAPRRTRLSGVALQLPSSSGAENAGENCNALAKFFPVRSSDSLIPSVHPLYLSDSGRLPAVCTASLAENGIVGKHAAGSRKPPMKDDNRTFGPNELLPCSPSTSVRWLSSSRRR